jgi:thiol-disulfide isomerase/thioredoxin
MGCIRFLFLIFFISGSLVCGAQEKLSVIPSQPERGQRITISYNPGAADAVIPDTATSVELVFTYSNLYELPGTIQMQKKGSGWETELTLPPYATYATFYLKGGGQRDQPAKDRHFEIAVFEKGKRVEDGYLYEGYSLPAQKGRVPGLAAMQAGLYQRELKNYPGNYEAKLRLLAYKMNTARKDKRKVKYRKKAEAIIAARFREDPGNMGSLNQVTMGYLIIGENSRLDSIRQVVKEKYPDTQAGYELITGDILGLEDSLLVIRQLEELVKKENISNQVYLTDAHQELMKLYAARHDETRSLYHLKRSGSDASPYRPATLKMQAEALMQGAVSLDTAFQLANAALELADQFPAGLIRYFPETGYLPAYITPETRARSTQKVTGQLLSLTALIEMKRGNKEEAGRLMEKALETSGDVETLGHAGELYEKAGLYESAFQAYKNIMLQVPEDSVSLKKMRATYGLWKHSFDGWNEQLTALNDHWKAEMMEELRKQMIRVKAPDFLKRIVDMQGKSVESGVTREKIVIIDFWATWCVPCMREMPYVQQAYDGYGQDPDVAFMIVNSASNNTLEDAQGWWGNKRYSFPVYYNTDPMVGEKFGFNLIPATYIIDKSGYIRLKTIGFEGPSIKRKIEAAIEMLRQEG